MRTIVTRFPAFAIGIPIGLAISAMQIVRDGSVLAAVAGFSIVVAYAAVVTALAPHSETASVLAGRPVDERWEHIGMEASALAFGISAIAVLAGIIVTGATGADWFPYLFVAVVMGIAFLGSFVAVRSRH